MKKIASVFIVMLFMACTYTLSAQKVGYVNTEIVIAELPQVKEANTNIETLRTQLMKKGQDMIKELQTKYQELQAKQNEISPLQYNEQLEALKTKEGEIQAFEQDSQVKLQKKSEELLKPIQDKVNAAIKAVATENGYTYIFDLAAGNILYADEKVDVSVLVTAKLKM